MNKLNSQKLLTLLLLSIMSFPLYASTHDVLADAGFNSVFSYGNDFLLVADNEGDNQAKPDGGGPLVLPGDDSEKSEKKCMKVCEKWGEDCVINPRTGTRKCRKVCKNFGEECF